jgi:molybdopterin-biosynthesis enzyme MoeA-like protein
LASECGHDPEALALLSAHYAERGLEFTEARRRMARMPEGSRHIANPCQLRARLHHRQCVCDGRRAVGVSGHARQCSAHTQHRNVKVLSDKVSCPYGEGDIGDPLSAIAKAHPDVNIGSYPRFSGQGFSTEIVIRGRDAAAIAAARLDM